MTQLEQLSSYLLDSDRGHVVLTESSEAKTQQPAEDSVLEWQLDMEDQTVLGRPLTTWAVRQRTAPSFSALSSGEVLQ